MDIASRLTGTKAVEMDSKLQREDETNQLLALIQS